MIAISMEFVKIKYITLGLCISAVTIMITGCTIDISPSHCENPDTNCFINHSLASIKIVKENINQWSSIQLYAQIIIAASSLVATIMIALQDDNRKHWTRPVGLVATSLVTATTSALVSFHVPDNVDKLINVIEDMASITNQFDSSIGELTAGKSPEEIKKMYQEDASFRKSYIAAVGVYSKAFNKLKIDMMRINGTASRMNIKSPQDNQNISQATIDDEKKSKSNEK